MDEFDKGASVDRTVVLKAGTTILNTNVFTEIEVKIFNFPLLRVVATYYWDNGTGDVSKVAPTTSGQIFFVVPETASSNIRALKYFYKVKTTEVNLDFPNGIRTRSWTGWCFKLKSTK